jgi:hypothetical protein
MALTWSKSSHSGGGGGDCVEVAFGTNGHGCATARPATTAGVLPASPAAFKALLGTLKEV